MQKASNRHLLIFCFAVLLPGQVLRAQTPFTDCDLSHIGNHFDDHLITPLKRTWIYKGDTTGLRRYNPAGLLLGSSLYLYQNILSKHISGTCLYSPSCSEFCKQALRTEGILKGTLLSVDRVNRCNRIAGQDLRKMPRDPLTGKYPDPVSKYTKKEEDEH